MDPRQLRAATRPEHEATEGSMPLLRSDLDLQQYVNVLFRLYPFVKGWECWAEAHSPTHLKGFVQARGRSAMLEADLRFFGQECPVQRAFPAEAISGLRGGETAIVTAHPTEAQSDAGFLGAMYVMEGSTLGGQYIAQHVEQTLGLEPGIGDAFFRGYGRQTGPMWKEFQTELAAVPEEYADELIQSAKCMFKLFADALKDCS